MNLDPLKSLIPNIGVFQYNILKKYIYLNVRESKVSLRNSIFKYLTMPEINIEVSNIYFMKVYNKFLVAFTVWIMY